MRIQIAILFILLVHISNAQIKNLVLEGGGIRGIAYVGAISELEKLNVMPQIENVAGTSVGAITAALLCVGYTSDELKQELSTLKLQKLNDGRAIFFGGIHRTNTRYGWYRGDKLTKWIADLLYKKTGNTDLTFDNLHVLASTSSQFKNLSVTATNLSKQCWQVLSFITNEHDVSINKKGQAVRRRPI